MMTKINMMFTKYEIPGDLILARFLVLVIFSTVYPILKVRIGVKVHETSDTLLCGYTIWKHNSGSTRQSQECYKDSKGVDLHLLWPSDQLQFCSYVLSNF